MLVENTELRLKDKVELGGSCLSEAKGAAYVKAGWQERTLCLGDVTWCLAWLEQRV